MPCPAPDALNAPPAPCCNCLTSLVLSPCCCLAAALGLTVPEAEAPTAELTAPCADNNGRTLVFSGALTRAGLSKPVSEKRSACPEMSLVSTSSSNGSPSSAAGNLHTEEQSEKIE